MSIKTILAITSVFFAGAAIAQAPVGTVASVQGLVTVTDGTTGGTAAAGTPIKNGMRFVTTSNGSAVLRLNNGCEVRLRPSQAVTVLQSMNCRELLAAVQSVAPTVVAGNGSAATGALATGGLVAGGAILNKSLLGKKSISSN